VIGDAEVVEAIERTGRGWVVECDGAVVAFAIGNAQTGNIWALFVDPAHEGRGHGRRLFDTMVAWLWSQDRDRLWLSTAPGTRAQRFYERAGWRSLGPQPSGELGFELRRPRSARAEHAGSHLQGNGHRHGETPMLVDTAAARRFAATPYAGIERALFRNNDEGGRSSMVRLTVGARFPRHAHHGSEEVVVMAGRVSIGGVELQAGDYLYTEPGEEHDVTALTEAMIFVSSRKATPVVE
jgi:quercetin dioxygenase-like cupin family protein